MSEEKYNSLGIQINDNALTLTEVMRTVTAAEFGIRVAKAFLDSRSSTALFFIQQAFADSEDDNGIFWEEFEAMLTRLTETDYDRTVIDGFLARVRERYDYLQSNLRCDSNSVFNFSDLHKHATNDVYAEMFPKEQSPSG